MSSVTRRRLLIGSSAGLVVTAGLGGFALKNGVVALIDDVIRDQFDDQIADAPAAQEFALHFIPYLLEQSGMSLRPKAAVAQWAPPVLLDQMKRDDEFRSWILRNFIYSTTAVRSYETGDELVFVSEQNFGSGQDICANTLSFNWL